MSMDDPCQRKDRRLRRIDRTFFGVIFSILVSRDQNNRVTSKSLFHKFLRLIVQKQGRSRRANQKRFIYNRINVE